MKLLRTIRLDASDTFIFPAAAEPGDWAISGAFVFEATSETLTGRKLAAFRGGFLGIPSLGWSTLAQVVDADASDRAAAIDALARCLIERYGAPDLEAARAAAAEELDFAASLAEHPTGTLVARPFARCSHAWTAVNGASLPSAKRRRRQSRARRSILPGSRVESAREGLLAGERPSSSRSR